MSQVRSVTHVSGPDTNKALAEGVSADFGYYVRYYNHFALR